MIYIGIDPGANGAAVAIRQDGKIKECRFSKATETDVADFLRRMSWGDGNEVFAFIERLQPLPNFGGESGMRGSISSFKVGQSYGFLRGLLVGIGVPFEEVQPRAWQKAMGITIIKQEGGTAKKNRHKARAQQLFPDRKIVHGNADALLIAEYGRRSGLGGS